MTCCRAAARIGVALLAATFAGCGSDDEGPRLVLGTGRNAFEAVKSDGAVPLIKGIQGGFHIWTSFLAYEFDTDVVRMEITTRWDDRDDSSMHMAGNMSLAPVTDPSGTPALVSVGWPAGIFNPKCANGQRIDIELSILDKNTGVTASTSGRWTVDVAPEDRATDCGE